MEGLTHDLAGVAELSHAHLAGHEPLLRLGQGSGTVVLELGVLVESGERIRTLRQDEAVRAEAPMETWTALQSVAEPLEP